MFPLHPGPPWWPSGLPPFLSSLYALFPLPAGGDLRAFLTDNNWGQLAWPPLYTVFFSAQCYTDRLLHLSFLSPCQSGELSQLLPNCSSFNLCFGTLISCFPAISYNYHLYPYHSPLLLLSEFIPFSFPTSTPRPCDHRYTPFPLPSAGISPSSRDSSHLLLTLYYSHPPPLASLLGPGLDATVQLSITLCHGQLPGHFMRVGHLSFLTVRQCKTVLHLVLPRCSPTIQST